MLILKITALYLFPTHKKGGNRLGIGACLGSNPYFGINHEIEINVIEITVIKDSPFEGDAEL